MECVHLGKLVFEKEKTCPNHTALKYRNDATRKWHSVPWGEMARQVRIVAKSLIELGVEEEEKIAIFSQNMVEMIIVDLACQAIRATTVPMYATSSASQIEYIINDANISFIFVGEQYQYDCAVEVLRKSSHLRKIIAIEPSIQMKGVDAALSFEDFKRHGMESQNSDTVLNDRMTRLSMNDLTTLIYTSGTTGEPKGVVLRQSNYQAALKSNNAVMSENLKEKELSLCFLPLSHIFERAWVYLCLWKGVQIAVNKNPKEIQSILKEVRPSMMCAVPRFWEKIYMGVNDKIDGFSPLMRKLMRRAVKIGERRNLEFRRYNKEVPTLLAFQYWIYSKTLFRILKKVIGLENGTFFPVAGAALSDEVNVFLHSVGFNICVGYGLTESTATVSCINPYNRNYEIGTVGDVVPGLEVRIGENDEIMLKGPTVTEGYYNKPVATSASFENGWFKTGDAGSFTPSGRLVIRERIKELFKTSNGKYIAPQQIEGKLIVDKYIEQAAVIGDQRKYVSALIVPSYTVLSSYADSMKIKYSSVEELLKNPKIVSFYEGRIQQAQKDLASFEQIKKFTLLANPFSSDNDELTLTLKLKRKVIGEHYAKEIEAMYEN